MAGKKKTSTPSTMDLAVQKFNETAANNGKLTADLDLVNRKYEKLLDENTKLKKRNGELAKGTSEREVKLIAETKRLGDDKFKLAAAKTKLEADKSLAVGCVRSLVVSITDMFGDTLGCRACYVAVRPLLAPLTAEDREEQFTTFKVMSPCDASLEKLEEDWQEAETKARTDGTFGPGWSPPDWRAPSLILDAAGDVYDVDTDERKVTTLVDALFKEVERLQKLRGIGKDDEAGFYSEEAAAMWLHGAINLHNGIAFGDVTDPDAIFDGLIKFPESESD